MVLKKEVPPYTLSGVYTSIYICTHIMGTHPLPTHADSLPISPIFRVCQAEAKLCSLLGPKEGGDVRSVPTLFQACLAPLITYVCPTILGLDMMPLVCLAAGGPTCRCWGGVTSRGGPRSCMPSRAGTSRYIQSTADRGDTAWSFRAPYAHIHEK